MLSLEAKLQVKVLGVLVESPVGFYELAHGQGQEVGVAVRLDYLHFSSSC